MFLYIREVGIIEVKSEGCNVLHCFTSKNIFLINLIFFFHVYHRMPGK